MKTALRLLVATAVVVIALGLQPAAAVTTITFQTFDLPDTPAGDLRQYVYQVLGVPFSPDEGFTIFFDETLYSDLANPTGPPGWDPQVVQPDLALPDAGFFDALALVNAPASGPFSVDFVWLGAGQPGSQPFDVFGVNPLTGLVTLLESGVTVPLQEPPPTEIPEPTTMLLLVTGVFGLAVVRRLRRR
jgi:hypothetical protein